MIYRFIIWIFYAEKSLILFHFRDLLWFGTRMKLAKPTAKISHNEIRLGFSRARIWRLEFSHTAFS